MNKTLTTHGVSIVVALLVGGFFGYVYEDGHHAHKELQMFSKGGGGGLTNPLLECGVETQELTIGERVGIEKSVREYVTTAKKQGVIAETAVYFRDLNNGPWFGINEQKSFQPASLLKLPIAMSIYYWDQRDSGVLERKIDLSKNSITTGSAFNNEDPSKRFVAPAVYSVRDLIGIMLRDSSNDAADHLISYEGNERMSKIFIDLGIEVPREDTLYSTSVKTYGAFFRVLYNASYIGQVASEEILTTLTQASFRDGLVAGVPSSVKVAHKYGTRIVEDAQAPRQLHDCGIVYAENSPYVLCIMSQSSSMKNAERFIAGVSKLVYDGVTKK